MKRLKKSASILSAAVLLFSSGVNSISAKSIDEISSRYEININEEISKAFNGETDLDIDMSEYFNVSFGGNEVEESDIYFTTTKLMDNKNETDTNLGMYATTILAESKTSHDSKVNSTYHVTAWLTIYWTDNLGPGNQLDSVSGGWSVESGYSVSFSERTLKTRGWNDASHYSRWVTNNPTSNTFSYGVNSLLPSNLTYFMFDAQSSVKLNNTTTMTLSVSTSMFD